MRLITACLAFSMLGPGVLWGQAIVPLNLANTAPRNDDGSAGPIPLGIDGESGINFFGQSFTQVYVNTNGNLTFSYALSAYTPDGLATGVGQPIIAPFFADVDTNPGGSPIMYGNATVNGFPAFVVNYVNVAYYDAADKLNSFQVILLDRSDTGAGNFDIEFNYGSIQWETGSASGGEDGLGGYSAVVGYSNGLSGANDVYYQLPGSLVPGSFINGGPLALMTHSVGSVVPGRYVFQVRNGVVSTPPMGPGAGALTVTGADLGTIPAGAAFSASISVSGGTPPYAFSSPGGLPPGITVNGSQVAGTPTQPGSYSIGIQVTDSVGASGSANISFSVFGFTSGSLPPGIPLVPYLASVGVSGGTPPYAFSFSGLPSGLSGTSSGNIQGTVRAPVTAQVGVTATDSTGVSASETLPLTFAAPAPIAVPSQTLQAGQLATTYAQTLNATGGAPPYTFTLSSGSLPQGLTLRPGGTVEGIPAQTGTFSFGVRATDYTGGSAVGAVSVTIAPPPLTLMPSGGALASGVAKVDYPEQTIAASGGAGGYQFAVTAGSLPGGLSLSSGGMITGTAAASGTFNFTVTATDTNSATASGMFSIMVRASSTDLLLSTSSLNFSLTTGATALPAAEQVGVQSTVVSTAIPYSVSVSPSTANWFTVMPSSGTTPSTFSVTLNSAALALAASTTPYQATISVTCASSAPCAGNSQQVTVSLNVMSQPPMLNTPTLVSFSTPASGPTSSSQSAALQNTGGGTIGISSISCADSWCSVSGTPGSIGPGATVSLNVTANPMGLAAGYYRSTIRIVSSVGTNVVPVTLFITELSSMALEPAGAQFQVSPGGTPSGPQQNFLVSVASATPVSYTASVSSNATWLTLGSTSGMASAAQPGTVNYSFNTSVIAGLAPGVYYGTIQVTIPGLVNSPQVYEVVLNVVPATAPQQPRPTPAGVLFITSATSTPPAQTVSVATSSSAPEPFAITASTTSGGNWLTASPALGTASPGSPAVTQISVSPAGLQPGPYYGGVTFAFGTAGVRTVNVTLIVTAAGTSSHEVSHATPGCTATQLIPAETGLLGNFSAPVAWPTPLTVQLSDDCGNAVTNGQIVATFSNGDPPLPLALANPSSGFYAATWTPRNSAAQVSINARASAPGLPSVTQQIAGTVTPNAAPVLTSNSTLNVFNPQVGAALAPGTLVQIAGSGLSGTSSTAPAGMALPTTLNGTQVILGGIAVPLQSVSPTMLTAEVPFELMPGMQYQVLVSANGALTTPDQVQLSNASPGVSTSMAGLLTAYHLSGTPVSEAAPAAPGEALFLLAAGLGATSTPVPDGAVSPASPPATVSTMPSLTINGEQAMITFAGLEPGVVGIYQVNFVVPADAMNGDLTLVLSQAAVVGNSAVLPVHM